VAIEFGNPVAGGNDNQFQTTAFNPNDMPPMEEAPKPNALTAGFMSGIRGLEGTLIGGGAGLVGKLVGSQGLQDFGQRVENAVQVADQKYGRPDLDVAPWQQGSTAGWLPYTGYQVAKMVPLLGPLGAAGKAIGATRAAAAAADALGLTSLGARAGAAMGLGAEAAGKVGADYLGTAAASYPLSASQMYEEAMRRQQEGGGETTGADAARALIGGVPHAAINGILPVLAPGIFAHGAADAAETGLKAGAKALAKGIGLGGVENAAAMAAQTAIAQTQRPDLSVSDKIDQIFTAAGTGLLVGGAIGGVAHAGGAATRAFSSNRDPNSISTEELKQLTGPGGAPGKTTVEPTGGTMYADPAGNIAQDQASVAGQGFGKSESEASGGLRQLDLNAQARDEAPAPPTREQQFAHVENDDLDRMLSHAEGQGDNANPEVLRALRSETDRRAHASMDDDTLNANLDATHGAIAKMQAEGVDLPASITTQLEKLTAEKERRAAGPRDEPNRPTTLINENDLDAAQNAPPPPPTAEEVAKQRSAESEARRQQVDRAEMQKKAEDLAGGSNQFIKKLTAENDVELGHQVLDFLDRKPNDKKARKIAQGLGLIDENGKPVDHAMAIDAAKDDLAKERVARLSEDPAGDMRNQSPTEHTYMDGVGSIEGAETMGGVHAAETRIKTLRDQQKLAQEVQRRRAGGDAAETQARPEATTPASTGPAPEFQLPLAPGTPQGYYETRKYLSGVVGGADKVVRDMQAKSLPEAIQATHDNLSSRDPKKWSKTFRQLGDHFGLIDENGKLMPLPEAVQSMSDKFEAAKRAGDAEAAGQFSQKLDDLNGALHGKIDEKPITGPSAVKAPEVKGKLDEESQFRQGKLRDAMHTIERSAEGIPNDLRKRAREARQALNQRAASAEEKAHAVMAEYKAHTGDDLPSFSKSGVDQHAESYNAGEKVHDDGKLGLIRSVGRLGNDLYLPSKRLADGSMWHGRLDVKSDAFDKATGHPFTQDEMSRLRDIAREHKAADLARYDENTEGPFAKIEPGSNVVASKSVDPHMSGLLSDWMQMLGLDKLRVFLAHTSDLNDVPGARAEYGLHGSYSKAFQHLISDPYGSTGTLGGRPGDHAIMLRDGMNQQHGVEVMGHELGHIIEREVLDRLPVEDKNAIVAEFHKWMTEKLGLRTAREYIQALRSAEAGREYSKQFSETTPRTAIMDGYHNHFKEWWADQVAKWATTQEKPVGAVEKFFSALGQKLRELAQLVTGSRFGNKDHLPVAAVKEFLDKMTETRDADAFIKSLGGKGLRTENTEVIRGPAMASERNVSPERQNETVRTLQDRAQTLGNDLWARAKDAAPTSFQKFLGWRSVYDIGQWAEKAGFGVAKLYAAAQNYHQVVTSRLSGVHGPNLRQLDLLRGKSRDMMNEVQRATELGVDPRKPWAKQSEEVRNAPNNVELKAYTEHVNSVYNEMGRIDQGALHQQYETLHASNNVAQLSYMAQTIHDMVALTPDWAKAMPMRNPTDTFLEREQIHETPQSAEKYWRDTLKGMHDAITDFTNTKSADAVGNDIKTAKVASEISPLVKLMHAHEQVLNAMDAAPNFHLGRDGQFFVAFNMRDENGVVNKVAQREVIKLLQEHAPGQQLSSASEKANVFIRLESMSAAENLRKVLGESKHIDPRSLQYGKRTEDHVFESVSPQWLKDHVQSLQAYYSERINLTDNPDEVKSLETMRDNTISVAKERFLDSLPDTAVARIMAHRDNVPGYNKDMIRNSAKRLEIATNGHANMAAAPHIADAFRAMAEQIADDKHNTDMPLPEKAKRGYIMEELRKRETDRQNGDGAGWSETLRAVNHNFYLAFNTAYALINMTQLGTMTWPELAKNGGYIEAAKTLGKHSATAVRIVKAMVQESYRTGGLAHIADGEITQRVMERAGLDAKQREFLTKLINTGHIDIGAQTRVMGQIADGKSNAHLTAFSKYASSFGLYSEMFSRIAAGMAAHDMAPKGVDPVAHAGKVINESLYNYSTWNQARQMGKNGIFKEASPVVFAFQSYQAFTLEKLYREFYDALPHTNKQMPAEQRAQSKADARTFIGGHMAAMGMMAGVLGMPIANIVAWGTEKLHDLISDDGQPYDAKASFRGFLSGMFGKTAGEMIAHGPLSRGLGAEVTARGGEADIIPFSRLLTDRRKWEDAWKDYSSRGWGAPSSMLNSLITGARDVFVDPIKGAQELLPVSLSNMVKAYDLSQHGYVDSNQQALPMKKPGGTEVLTQALGFTPARKAEYNEERLVQQQRSTVLNRQAQVIRGQLAVAWERGDDDGKAKWMQKAQEFDKHNPSYAIMPRMGQLLESRARARGIAEATHTPAGVNMKDIIGRGSLGFANY
jgi:hypothetical protein